jgi:hypothetical protein
VSLIEAGLRGDRHHGVRGIRPGIVRENVHTKKYNHVKGNGKGDKISIPDASEKFHV